jgi:purine-binding chemotaxis protein CheW
MPTQVRSKMPPSQPGERQENSGSGFLIVRLDATICGIAVDAVRTITRAVAVTALRGGPRGVEGIVDFHGQIIPVVDLRDRLGLPARDEDPVDHFIVADTGARLCGFRVDEALGVESIEAADVVEASAIVTGSRPIAGIARAPDGLVLLQDLAAMLSQSEEELLTAALSAHVSAPTS